MMLKPDLFFSVVVYVDMVPLAEQQKVDAIVDLFRNQVVMLQTQLDLLELKHKVTTSFQLAGNEPVNILLKEHKLYDKTSE